jgi:hypothetical protein
MSDDHTTQAIGAYGSRLSGSNPTPTLDQLAREGMLFEWCYCNNSICSPEVVGFYMGPDGYCWGREAMDLEAESPRQLVMQKQWFSFMLLGRLSYDPTLPDDVFRRTVAESRPRQGTNKELRLTLGDIEAFSCLRFYYAAKVEGACELALFDADSAAEHQAAAVRHLEAALGHWRDYAAVYTRQYRQALLYNRVGIVDVPGLTEQVAADIKLARNWKPGVIGKTPPCRGGGSKFGQ